MVLNPDVVYVAVSGPQYETRADIMFLRMFGAIARTLRHILTLLKIDWLGEELKLLAKMKTVGMSLLAELNLMAIINKDRARIREKIEKGEPLEQWEKDSPTEPMNVGAINFVSNNEAHERTEILSHAAVLVRGKEYQQKFGQLLSHIVSVDW